MIVLRARRGGTGSKKVTFRGGLRRVYRYLLVGSGAAILNLCGAERSCMHGYAAAAAIFSTIVAMCQP